MATGPGAAPYSPNRERRSTTDLPLMDYLHPADHQRSGARQHVRAGSLGLHDGLRHHPAPSISPTGGAHGRRVVTSWTIGPMQARASRAGLADDAAGDAIACVVAAALNYLIEKVAYRRLRNSPRLAPLITAIGMSILQVADAGHDHLESTTSPIPAAASRL